MSVGVKLTPNGVLEMLYGTSGYGGGEGVKFSFLGIIVAVWDCNITLLGVA